MISRDDLINEALYSVGAEALAHDFANNPNDRLNIYKIYETSVRYVTEISKMELLLKYTDAVENPDMDEGWYYMPDDFVHWLYKMSPVKEYTIDEKSKYSMLLEDKQIAYYAYYENITSLDPFLKQAIKWQLLSELKAADSSIMQYSQLIDTERMLNIQRLRTKTKFSNISTGK